MNFEQNILFSTKHKPRMVLEALVSKIARDWIDPVPKGIFLPY